MESARERSIALMSETGAGFAQRSAKLSETDGIGELFEVPGQLVSSMKWHNLGFATPSGQEFRPLPNQPAKALNQGQVAVGGLRFVPLHMDQRQINDSPQTRVATIKPHLSGILKPRFRQVVY